MSAGFRPRTFLNRGDPRLRGVVTWLPMDGHFTNTGDIGGRIAVPPSTGGWQPSPLAGTFLLCDDEGSADTRLTPANMGVSGSAHRTCFLEYYHAGVAGFTSLFAFGSSGANALFALAKNSATVLKIEDNSTGLSLTLPASTGMFVRAVARYDGTNYSLFTRCYIPATNTWTDASSSAARSQNTGSGGLGLHFFPDGFGPDSASGLSYLGIVGGYAWTDDETRDFLRDPSKLWGPAPSKARYYVVTAATYNDTIAGSVTAADTVTATLTTGATVSDAATGADSLAVALTARPALSDAVAGADSSAAALTARPTIADAATAGDTSAAALTANAAISDPVTGGDAMVGGKLTSDPISDAVAGADSLAVALTARPATSDAVTSADSQAAALTARPALSDGVTAGDTIAPALTTAATIADAVTAADALTGAKVTSATLSDGATAGEAAAVAATFAATLSDGVTAGDGVTGTTGEQLEDSVTAADGAAVAVTFNVTFADGVAAGDDVTASGGTPPAPSAGITGGGPWAPMPRRRRWRVRTPGGLLEGFDTAEEAWARFREFYGPPEPEPSATRTAPRQIVMPALPARTVAFDGADATRSFARLLRDMQQQREAEAHGRVMAMLHQIATDAARRAAQLEEDDEAAAILLLH